MYKTVEHSQYSFFDFNQSLGLHMNPENRWIKMADSIPWDAFEKKYARKFKSGTGNVAKPLRMALGALIIQKKYNYSDRELIEQLTENPYYQYFIGLPGFQEEPPFDASTLVLFRKRLDEQIIMEANNYMISAAADKKDTDNKDDDQNPPSGTGSSGSEKQSGEKEKEPVNSGTVILDASCAPVNVRFPQDVSLLNEAREKLETVIFRICDDNGIYRPRTYKKRARKDYLAFAKSRKHPAKKIRAAIRKQLNYVKRDLIYVDGYVHQNCSLTEKEKELLEVIRKVYDQQKYMYDHKTHTVENRIVSINQPWIRPIVRGKAGTPVEFGAKLDLSIDTEGYARIEKLSFDAYNESTCLITAVKNYHERTGRYPERVLADQIYRTRENRKYCKEHGIRLSGPKLGRPTAETKVDKKAEYQDNVDRIEVEREFSLEKRCYGLGRIDEKTKETQLSSIALSVFVANLFKIQRRILFSLFHVRSIVFDNICWLSLKWA